MRQIGVHNITGVSGELPTIDQHLGVVYVMDLAPLQYVIGYWTHPKTTSVYIKKKKCKSDHETWDLQNVYFHAYIMHCHGPTGFAMGEAKEVLSLHMMGPWQREAVLIFSNNFVLLLFFLCQTFPWLRGKKERRRGQNRTWRKFPKLPFLDIYFKKVCTSIFGCMVTSLYLRSVYT